MIAKVKACLLIALFLALTLQSAFAQELQVMTHTQGNGHMIVLSGDGEQALLIVGEYEGSKSLMPLIMSGEILSLKTLFIYDETPVSMGMAAILCGLMNIESIYTVDPNSTLASSLSNSISSDAVSEITPSITLTLGADQDNPITIQSQPEGILIQNGTAAIAISSAPMQNSALEDQTVVWFPTNGLTSASKWQSPQDAPDTIVVSQEEYQLFSKFLVNTNGIAIEYLIKDNGSVRFTLSAALGIHPSGGEEQAQDAQDDAGQSENTADTAYIGNVNSKKLHLPTCSSLPAEKNQVLFSAREDAITKGYVPCKVCKP